MIKIPVVASLTVADRAMESTASCYCVSIYKPNSLSARLLARDDSLMPKVERLKSLLILDYRTAGQVPRSDYFQQAQRRRDLTHQTQC